MITKNIKVIVNQENLFTGLPSNLDVARVTDQISRQMADNLVDDVGLQDVVSFTGGV